MKEWKEFLSFGTMPVWLVQFLLVVFLIHLAVFSRLAFKRRLPHYYTVSVTFFFLVLAFSVRLLAPDFEWLGTEVHLMIRIVAWIFTALTIGLYVRRRIKA